MPIPPQSHAVKAAEPAELDNLANYLLTTADAARAFGVHVNTIRAWTVKGTRDGWKLPHKLRAGIRVFAAHDLVAFAERTGLAIDEGKLRVPIPALREGEPSTERVFYEVDSTRLYSEKDAADVLGIPRATLSYRRRNGFLNPAVKIIVEPHAVIVGKPSVFFAGDQLQAIIDGKLELYSPEGRARIDERRNWRSSGPVKKARSDG